MSIKDLLLSRIGFIFQKYAIERCNQNFDVCSYMKRFY